ncbi:hypothetical protein, partial [Mycobacterium marinum]|uniref:hypothetical protein n=1 Tax=Mycobacterium marinum TaxID=1781 RepID=UPI003FEE3442
GGRGNRDRRALAGNPRPTGSALGESLHRRAGADQVAVAIGAVDTARRRPDLRPKRGAERVGRFLAGVRVVPLAHQQTLRRVWRAP